MTIPPTVLPFKTPTAGVAPRLKRLRLGMEEVEFEGEVPEGDIQPRVPRGVDESQHPLH